MFELFDLIPIKLELVKTTKVIVILLELNALFSSSKSMLFFVPANDRSPWEQHKWSINKLGNKIWQTLCYITKWLFFSIRRVFDTPRNDCKSVKSIKFSSKIKLSVRWKRINLLTSKWTEHVSIVRLIALTGKACWLYVQLLCSLVRSTCNLERVWIPMLLFPAVSGHSRSKYRVNENWRFEVIVTFLKTLFWILTGFFWFRKVTCLASIFMNSCIKLKAWQTVWSEWRC